MGSAPPAFQFYASDFLASVSSMTLDERGAHITLMAWSWEHGPVPNNIRRIATILGVSRGAASRVWDEVQKRWSLTPQDDWKNRRLEEVRAEQAEFVARQSVKGEAGARARWGVRSNGRSNGTGNGTGIARPLKTTSKSMADSSPADGPPISDLQSPNPVHKEREQGVPPARDLALVSAKPLIDGMDNRRHGQHPKCFRDRGLCVTPWVWDELFGRIGGDSSTRDPRLRQWMDLEVTKLGDAPVGDKPDDWWRKRFAAWVGVESNTTTMVGKGDASRNAMAQTLARRAAAREGTQQ